MVRVLSNEYGDFWDNFKETALDNVCIDCENNKTNNLRTGKIMFLKIFAMLVLFYICSTFFGCYGNFENLKLR